MTFTKEEAAHIIKHTADNLPVLCNPVETTWDDLQKLFETDPDVRMNVPLLNTIAAYEEHFQKLTWNGEGWKDPLLDFTIYPVRTYNPFRIKKTDPEFLTIGHTLKKNDAMDMQAAIEFLYLAYKEVLEDACNA